MCMYMCFNKYYILYNNVAGYDIYMYEYILVKDIADILTKRCLEKGMKNM